MKESTGWFIVIVVLLAFVFGIYAFKSCYDDHRNQLGFSVITSVQSCSG